MFPKAYHLVISTYGTRLQGGDRPTVHRRMNKPGQDFLGKNQPLNVAHRDYMKNELVYFTSQQRLFIQSEVPVICETYGWVCHLVACQPDHCHMLISAEKKGKGLRAMLKQQLTKVLNQTYGHQAKWWAKSGAVKPVISSEYQEEVHRYIREQVYIP